MLFRVNRGGEGRGDSMLGIMFNYPRFACSYNIGPLHSTVCSRGLIIVQIGSLSLSRYSLLISHFRIVSYKHVIYKLRFSCRAISQRRAQGAHF